MNQCVSALLLIETLGVLNENSPCFKAVLHLRVVCCIIFGFLFSYCDHCKLVSTHPSLVVIDMVNHHTGVTQMGDLHLGDLPYKDSGVILPSSVKKEWLVEGTCL